MTKTLWLCDDSPHWHNITENTIDTIKDWNFRGFLSGQSLLSALQDSEVTYPDVICMDFYLGNETGDAITRLIRESHTPAARCCIVGFSSVSNRSDAIVQAGANIAIPKRDTGNGVNNFLYNFLLDDETE